MNERSTSIEMTEIHPDQSNLIYGWPIEKYNKWMDGVNRRRRLKPFDERRIGWIRSLPNYKILCCGNSATDLILIVFLLILLYAFNALFTWGISTISGYDMITTPHVFGVVGILFVITIFIVLHIEGKVIENEYLEQLASENV